MVDKTEVFQVLFWLSSWENLEHAQELGQVAKDRVLRLVEVRILAEILSWEQACKIVATKLGASWHTERQRPQAVRSKGRVVERTPEDLEAGKIARVRRENPKLRDTADLLKAASAFSYQNPTQSRGYDQVYR